MYNTEIKQWGGGGKLALALLCPIPQDILCKLRMDLTLQDQSLSSVEEFKSLHWSRRNTYNCKVYLTEQEERWISVGKKMGPEFVEALNFQGIFRPSWMLYLKSLPYEIFLPGFGGMCGPKAQCMLVFFGWHLLFSLRSSGCLWVWEKVTITVLCSHHQQSLWRESTE